MLGSVGKKTGERCRHIAGVFAGERELPANGLARWLMHKSSGGVSGGHVCRRSEGLVNSSVGWIDECGVGDRDGLPAEWSIKLRRHACHAKRRETGCLR